MGRKGRLINRRFLQIVAGLAALALLLVLGARLDAVSPIVGYNVYRSTTSGGPYTRLIWAGSLGSPSNNVFPVSCCSYPDNSITPGQTYYYVITAFSGVSCGTGCYYATAESNYSSQASATPTPSVTVTWSGTGSPSPPTSVVAVPH
jgi:hypothetical protein